MSNISVTTTQNVIEVTQTGGITVTTPEGQTIAVTVPNSIVNVTNTTDDITITEVGITNTDQLIEGTTNLFFTNARARAAISLTTDDASILDYNSTTGVFTWDTPTTTKIAEGTNQYFTQARARQSLSAGTGISYDNSTGVITNTSINTDTTYTIDAATATGGANLTLTGSDSSTDSVKFASGTNITVSRTDANTITIDGTDTNTTYTQNASSTSGGANLNLVGSDSTTDSVKFAGGTNITVSRTDANTITIDGSDLNTTYTIASAATTGGANLTLTGSDSSTDSVAYKGAGATTVTSTDANTVTITSTDTNTTYTQNASSTSGGANLNLVGSDSTTDSIKLASGTNVTVTRTDADTVTISSTDTNTTYTVDATATSGGANLNLTGSDSSTDSVAYLGSGATTITRTDANTITVSSTDTNTTYTQNASSTSGGANLNLVGSDSTTDSVAYLGSGATTVTRTDDSTITISSTDTNTTYTQNFSSTTGGTNLNLVGSDSTTDTVKFANGTGVTVAYTDADTATISVGQSIGTGDSPTFAGGTFGNVTVGVDTDQTISTSSGNLVLQTAQGTNAGTMTLTAGSNGNITLAPNGTGKVISGVTVVADNSMVLGSLLATTNSNYTFPSLPLATISGNNGVDVASSMPANSLGYGAQQQFTHYFGDTFASGFSTAVLSLKSAVGNSVTGGTVPFTGAAQVAASGLLTNAALGTVNYNGYTTTGFSDYVGSRNQGGGFNGLHATQIQSYAAENFADSTLTISGATITNVSRFSTTLSSVTVTGTKGQISFTGTATGVGTAINVTGTNTGTSTGITAGTYYVIAATSTTNITLSATPGGQPINTTAGTTTGLTFLRRGVTFTYSTQSNIPFGLNALITVANVTGVTNGTYMAIGTSTITTATLGIDTTSVSLPGTQSLSLTSVSNVGTGFRVRAFPLATPMNSGNRLDLIDHKANTATYRSDSFVISGGSYGNTGTAYATFNATNTTLTKPLVLNGSTSGSITLSAGTTPAAQTYTLPTAYPTANNQVLVSTTGGVTSWVSTNSLAANYLDAEWVTAIGTLTANTIYGLPLASVSATNITIATGAIPIDDATSTGPTRITFAQTGRYNLQFSIQLKNTDSAEQDIDLWLRKNTADVADSNTQITVIKQTGGNPGKNIIALNLLLNVTSVGDYYELVYVTTNANCKPETIAAISSPYVRPRTPSVLLTVVPIGA